MVACVLGLEGAHALDGNMDNLDDLFNAGFRVMGLTHFFDNDMAGSSTGMKKYGLTPKGRELVHRLEARHILVDLAHASGATIDDVTAIATRPVIVSHTGVRGTCNNARNLSDKQIEEVARTGGVIGIGYWSTAVCGTDATSVAKAIRYAVSIAGVKHVALGSDFDGSTAMPFDTTGIVQVTDALLKEGFTESEIRLIMGENSLRVLRGSLP
jgi:microsomal dipeptidase-like Zn-dependent dipeptidase